MVIKKQPVTRMFNYNATDLPLSLSQAQKDALKQYTTDFKELMERKKPVPLDFSMGLQTQLSEVFDVDALHLIKS